MFPKSEEKVCRKVSDLRLLLVEKNGVSQNGIKLGSPKTMAFRIFHTQPATSKIVKTFNKNWDTLIYIKLEVWRVAP